MSRIPKPRPRVQLSIASLRIVPFRFGVFPEIIFFILAEFPINQQINHERNDVGEHKLNCRLRDKSPCLSVFDDIWRNMESSNDLVMICICIQEAQHQPHQPVGTLCGARHPGKQRTCQPCCRSVAFISALEMVAADNGFGSSAARMAAAACAPVPEASASLLVVEVKANPRAGGRQQRVHTLKAAWSQPPH